MSQEVSDNNMAITRSGRKTTSRQWEPTEETNDILSEEDETPQVTDDGRQNPRQSDEACRAPNRPTKPPRGIDPVVFQEQMMAMMNLLSQMMASNRTSSLEPTRAPEPKVKDPETFNGLTDKVNSFIMECNLVFALQPSRFIDTQTQVTYMLSLLWGTASTAARPLIENEFTPEALLTQGNFVEYLRTNYGNPDEKGSAQRALKAL